jgi:hypothetical protein
MRIMARRCLAALLLTVLPVSAGAWGLRGHEMIDRAAMQSLPTNVPSFLRSQAAVDEIVALGPEEDRLKGAGESWDRDNDPGHFLDVGDDMTVARIVRLNALPPNMEAYTQALETVGSNPYRAGYLPYSIIDGFERLRMDFALWRVDRSAPQRALREALILRDIGDWSHFVGDGSQPLHVTVHYDGWGRYPNPEHFTRKHIHAFFESTFAGRYAKESAVRNLMGVDRMPVPTALLSQSQIDRMFGAYLADTNRNVVPLYRLYAQGAFARGTPAAVRFTDLQLARGAAMLRDAIVLAWEDSINESVGHPAVPVRTLLGH